MATPLEAIFSASLGLLGGLIGAGVLERLKAGVVSLDAELVRLETFEDDLFDVFACPNDDEDRPAMLRQLSGRRRRLGLNIRRKIVDSVAYEACKSELVKLNDYLQKAEDGDPLTEEIEADIHTSVLRLSHTIRRSSRMAKAFALLRGE